MGEGEAGATRQHKESAGGEKERTAAMAERTGVADHRATGVAVVGGEQVKVERRGSAAGRRVNPPTPRLPSLNALWASRRAGRGRSSGWRDF